jgi:NCS1 family nucleobase:cation symporter-1
VVVTVGAALLAIYGYDWVHRVFRYLLFVLLPLVAIITIGVIAGQAGGVPSHTAYGFNWTAFMAQLSAAAAYNITYAGYVSDYSRYLPASSQVRAVTAWPVVGVGLPMLLLGLFGLLLPTIDVQLAQKDGVLAVISAHAPWWVAVPFFVFIVVGEIWANYLDVYTAGLVSLAMGIRLQRWQTALGCGILGTALAAYAVLVTDFHVAYEDFLILTYLWAPAWAAVVLLSFFVFEGKARATPALIAWLAGTVASLVFVNYQNIFGNTFGVPSYFNDTVIRALHGADISGLVSMGVAAVAYLALSRA